MKLLEVKTNKIMYTMPITGLTDLMSECFRNLNCLRALEEVLVTPEQYHKAGHAIAEQRQERLDQIELASSDLSTSFLSVYAEAACAPTPALYRRVKNSVLLVTDVHNVVDEFAMQYVSPDDKDAASLLELVKSAIGELSVFLFYAFSMDATEASIKEDRELEITVALKDYTDDHSLTVAKVVSDLRAVINSHRVPLSVFDSLPNLSEQFYELAGSLLPDFEEFEEAITTKMVLDVVSGDLEPEEAIQQLIGGE